MPDNKDTSGGATRPEQWLLAEINKIATRYELLAKQLERIAASVEMVGSTGYPSYGQVVRDVLDEIRVHEGNTHTGRLVTMATDADIARAEAKAADQ